MMKYIWRLLLVLALLVGMMFVAPVGPMNVDSAMAEVAVIPMTAKSGAKPLKSGYTENGYEDPSISVSIERGRIYETNYVVAHVKLQNASQIRTTMAQSYYSPSTLFGTTMARRANAVLAINGDFFSSRNNEGYVARQGKVYRTKCNNQNYDILIIDENGDLNILEKPNNDAIAAFEGTPINGFTFGPGLIVNGEVRRHEGNSFYAGEKSAQRMCLAQIGPLEYLCICSEGPEDPGSVGMTLDQFTDFVATFDGEQQPYKIINAYNLDGGSSSTMVFNGDKINSPNNPKARPLCDMIYFASAWLED